MYSDEEILEHLTEGEGRGFLGRSMYDAIIGEIEQLTISLQAQEELTTSWYNKTKQQNKEIERLNNIINELENLIKEDIITNLCEIENKRIGYGQTEVDKIWLHNLWGFKKYIINRCDEILKGENK